MKAYVQTISSISHQDSFDSNDVFEGLKKLEAKTELISPDYKAYIDSASLRRLSPVLRMGLTTAKACQATVTTPFDAISVGTALGCLKDTEKFLVTYLTSTSDFLSPTAFIQSTHNTIGGQISLGLGNHAYNMTHTQNNISFEVALLDGILNLEEGRQNVLVGAADERIDFLENFRNNLLKTASPYTSGATFLGISPNQGTARVGIVGSSVNFDPQSAQDEIEHFLKEQGLTLDNISLLLANEAIEVPATCTFMNYVEYTGLHFSASSFAFHIAHDFLAGDRGRYALVVNTLCSSKMGLILLERV